MPIYYAQTVGVVGAALTDDLEPDVDVDEN